MSLLIEAYQALRALPLTLSRGWPQAALPLPSLALAQADDCLCEDGSRKEALELTLRAHSPEQADSLSLQVEAVLLPLSLRQTLCRDGMQKDSGCFTKALKYQRTLPPQGTAPLALSLQIGGESYPARLLLQKQERALHPVAGLSPRKPRLYAGAFRPCQLRLQLGAQALPALLAAFAAGQAVEALSGSYLIAAYRLQEGVLTIDLSQTKEDA